MLRMDRDRYAALAGGYLADARDERRYEKLAQAREAALPPSLGAIVAFERAQQDAEFRGVPFPEGTEPRYLADVYRVRQVDGEGRYQADWSWDPLCSDRWGAV